MPSKRPRIVVAEDVADMRELIRIHLDQLGFEVHAARNGAEALDLVHRLDPSALVLDINMPEVDGFQVLEEIGGRLPILVLSARNGSEDVLRAMPMGAKDYLAKPFTRGQLEARIVRLLRRRSPAAARARTFELD